MKRRAALPRQLASIPTVVACALLQTACTKVVPKNNKSSRSKDSVSWKTIANTIGWLITGGIIGQFLFSVS